MRQGLKKKATEDPGFLYVLVSRDDAMIFLFQSRDNGLYFFYSSRDDAMSFSKAGDAMSFGAT